MADSREKTISDVDEMSIAGLRNALTEMQLSTKGSLAVLRNRLRKAHGNVEKTDDAATGDDEKTDGCTDDEGDNVDVDSLSVNELKTQLRRLGSKVTGNKATLKARLKEALQSDDEDEECDSNSGDDREESVASRSHRRRALEDRTERRRTNSRQVTLTFKDVEEALETFSGDGNQNVRRWLNNFEETAELCEWSDTQRLIYAKRLLRGSAKLFVSFESAAKKWNTLRRALLEEFSRTTNSKRVHQQLSAAQKKQSESYQEYVYRMLEIASHTDIEVEAKLQYIIEGIPDDESSKSILYGASSIKELRVRLTQYEMQRTAVRNRTRDKPATLKPKKNSREDADTRNRRCYNCGEKNHLGKECPNKAKGIKCFSCGEFGHTAARCFKEAKTTAKTATKAQVEVTNASDKKTYKLVNVLGRDVEAIIDSGSDLHLVRASLYVELGAPKLDADIVPFTGVGATNLRTLGSFEASVQSDGLTFHLTIHVVPDRVINHDLLLGGELSDFAEIRLRKRKATLEPLDNVTTTRVDETKIHNDDISLEAEWREILNISVYDDEPDVSIDLNHIVSPTVRSRVKEMIEEYRPVQAIDSGVKMRIVLKEDTPVYQNPRRLSHQQREIVNDIIADWEAKGIIRPSISDYASPIVLTTKKNGQPRLCVDYRGLNRKIIRDRFPLPLIEDQLDRLQDATVFTTLDLRDGFFHVPIEEDSIKYTAFVVPDGQFEFLRVPFGLSNSPAVFQRHIRVVFQDLIKTGAVLTYLDDLIVPAKTDEENLEKLEQVLNTASKHGLLINWRKCNVLVQRVEYLGHIVENGTVRPSEGKVQAVARFPEPASTKAVQSFLGLTGYFRKFIPRYAAIARPLSELLKDGVKFHFGPAQKQAFEELKTSLMDDPVLKLYRVGAETELHTDASKFGLGAVLLQKDADDGALHPVYYASWKTTSYEQKFTSYELEILAVIKALKKFRVYLLGIPVKIVTDCKAFALTMKKKDTCVRVAHWALLIEEFDYTIEHRPGKSMRHADALSRHPVSILVVQNYQDSLIARIHQAQIEDAELSEIIRSARDSGRSEFTTKRGILYRESDGDSVLVVPRSLQYEVIRQTHEKGHFGWKKTEHMLRQEFWFPQLRSKIQKFVRNCIPCILAEKKQGKAEGYLNPLEKGGVPLDTFHIDHLGPMPSTKKCYNHLFVVIDAFTKYTWIYPTKSTTSEEAIEKLKKQAIIFGNPRRIVSDRGTAFTSNAFKQYCETQDIEHTLITTGVPRGNGQVERQNRVIISILSKLSASNPAEWHRYIEATQQFINASYNRSIGMTPFELLVGRVMKLKEDSELRASLEKEIVELFRQERSELRTEAKANIAKIQEENRRHYNRSRKKAVTYTVGDLVAIRRTQGGPGLKLYSKYLGPYKVTSQLRNDRYLVEKIGDHEGPQRTSTSADYMKPWPTSDESGFADWDSDNDFDDDRDDNDDAEDGVICRMAECGSPSRENRPRGSARRRVARREENERNV